MSAVANQTQFCFIFTNACSDIEKTTKAAYFVSAHTGLKILGIAA